jgi:hypothetical protein
MQHQKSGSFLAVILSLLIMATFVHATTIPTIITPNNLVLRDAYGNIVATSLTVALINNTDGYVQLARALTESGTTYPIDPAVGYLYYRTDLQALYIYTGVIWVTAMSATLPPRTISYNDLSDKPDLSVFLLENGTNALTNNWNVGSYGIYGLTYLTSTLVTTSLLNVTSYFYGYGQFWWNNQNRTDAIANPTGPYNYIIDKSGSTYRMKNGTTGQIDFQSTNASKVIIFALGNLSSGRTWKEKIVIEGSITVTNTLVVPSFTVIDIEGSITLASSANCNIFNLTSVNDVEIYGGHLYGNKAGNTAGIGVCIDTPTYIQDTLDNIHDMSISEFATYGVAILRDTRAVTMRNIAVYSCDDFGFYIGGGDHFISDCLAGQNTGLGFYLADVGGSQLVNCKAFGTSYDSSFGDGFLISGVRDILTNCYAQENDRHGFLIYSSSPTVYARFNSLSNCVGESNNFNGTLSGVGIRLDGVNNNTVLGGMYTNMIGTDQDYGVWLANAAADNTIIGTNCLNNRVDSFLIDVAALGLNVIQNNMGYTTDCPVSTNGTFTLTSDTTEHTIVTLTPTSVEQVTNFYLDLSELTQNCTLRVYLKIDGVNYVELTGMTVTCAAGTKGMPLKDHVIDTAWKLTIQSAVAEGASRSIDYRYFVNVY